jgi:chemotaxis family two-component system sensor kinase Cph1
MSDSRPTAVDSTVVNLTNCESEPIHRPGAVQPHGVLVACRGEQFEIVHISENVQSLFGLTAAELLGQPLVTIFAENEAAIWDQQLRQEVTDTRPTYLFTVGIRGVEQTFDVIAHRSDDLAFVEFEPSSESSGFTAPDLYRRMQTAFRKFHQTESIEALYRACAQQVRTISGFDRVMVYRFDDEWNGQVVAEERREDLEPFLGLHYPAADIPAQARELYTKNWLRFIPDRDYRPVAILGVPSAKTSADLDLSFSVLRSVSPIHIEYLRNMGVGASMSISLLREGRLWGLIACHHYTPRLVPFDVRTACELLGQILSLTLSLAEDRQRESYRREMMLAGSELVRNVIRHDDTMKALIDSDPNMLTFVEADGGAVVLGDNVARIGQTPGDDNILAIVGRLRELPGDDDVFATDCWSSFSDTTLLGNVAAGVLAISLNASRSHYVLWFRAEQIRTVDWAGDPAKSITKGDGSARLSPRGSFALWRETVRGRSNPWTAAELEAAKILRDGIMRQMLQRSESLAAINQDLRLASEEREKTLQSERAARAESDRLNRMKDDFVATLSHELRTPLNSILGWSQIFGLTKQDLPPEMQEGVAVIERNARSQAQMIDDLLDVNRIMSGKLRLDLQDAHLPSIVQDALASVAITATNKGVRIEKLIDPLMGVETTGDPGRLQQIVWNLLSNAVKFTPKGGKVQLVLQRVNSHIELSISDTGQGIEPEFLPHVFDRFRQADASSTRRHGGLGLGLSIVRSLVELHGGSVQAFSSGTGRGSTFVVSLPVRAMQRKSVPSDTSSDSSMGDALNLSHLRILVVDDEADARLLTRRILEANQCVVTPADSVAAALAETESSTFDLILSDIGMPGSDGYEFIRKLRAREAETRRTKTPAIALTAYARPDDRRRSLLAGFQAHIAKPFEAGELLALIASLTGRV